MEFKPSRLTNYDKESILNEVKRVTEQFNGKPPSQKEFDKLSIVHSSTVSKVFGSWDEAMSAAGIEIFVMKASTDELKADLHRVFVIAGKKYFTQNFYINNGGQFSVNTLKSYLNQPTWQELLNSVLNTNKTKRVIIKNVRKKKSREELLEEIANVWKEIGRRPTYSEFKSFPGTSIRSIERTFGSWTEAIFNCSEKYKTLIAFAKGTNCTPDILLTELSAISEKNTKTTLSYLDYKSLGGAYSITSFQKYFDSWKNAVSLIGMKDGHYQSREGVKKYSDEDYFSQLQLIWEKLGRQPTSKEMKAQGSQMSPQAYQKRFGTWTKAIHAFCKDRNEGEANYQETYVNEVGFLEANDSETNYLEIVHYQEKENKLEENLNLPQDGYITVVKSTPRNPSVKLRFRVMQRDNFRCVICGRSPATQVDVILHIDHIIPYSQEGETTFENLQTLCSKCNLGKSDWVAE